jgi:hypothetical protein
VDRIVRARARSWAAGQTSSPAAKVELVTLPPVVRAVDATRSVRWSQYSEDERMPSPVASPPGEPPGCMYN